MDTLDIVEFRSDGKSGMPGDMFVGAELCEVQDLGPAFLWFRREDSLKESILPMV